LEARSNLKKKRQTLGQENVPAYNIMVGNSNQKLYLKIK
jgi:hypothetical protein